MRGSRGSRGAGAVGFHAATRSVQSTPADNAREGARQYILSSTTVRIKLLIAVFQYCRFSLFTKDLFSRLLSGNS